MVNLDTLGTGQLRIDKRSDKQLIALVQQLALAQDVQVKVTRQNELIGDWQVFRAAGRAVLSLHSINPKTRRAIHTSRDNFQLIDQAEFVSSARLAERLTRALDQP